MRKKEIREKLTQAQQPGETNYTGTVASIDDAKVDKLFKRERRKQISKQREAARLERHKKRLARHSGGKK